MYTPTLADIYRLLASEPRLAILAALAGGPLSVGGLAAITGASFSSTSQNLARLRAADVVDSRRNGQIVEYFLVRPMHPVVRQAVSLMKEGT
jgi:DNA-binding transcriptional ArsR family regulator